MVLHPVCRQAAAIAIAVLLAQGYYGYRVQVTGVQELKTDSDVMEEPEMNRDASDSVATQLSHAGGEMHERLVQEQQDQQENKRLIETDNQLKGQESRTSNRSLNSISNNTHVKLAVEVTLSPITACDKPPTWDEKNKNLG